jgi:hypothetical protein
MTRDPKSRPPSNACADLKSAYEETSPHDLTIIAAGRWSCPKSEACEEKAGLSLISQSASDSLR